MKIKHIETKQIPVKVGFKLKDGGMMYFKATKVIRVRNNKETKQVKNNG